MPPSSLGALGPDTPTHLIRPVALVGVAMVVAWPVHAQPAPTGQPPPNAVSVEQAAIFDVTSATGTLKETVQKEQQLVWHARRSPNERRFQLTGMSVAFLRNQAPAEVKITFAAHVSAFGWRPDGEPKLNVTVHTRGGASIYSWTFDVSVRCADNNRPLPSLRQTVPNDIAANLFNSVGAVEISEYREPASPILTARPCPSGG
jgi:hypothetical protein